MNDRSPIDYYVGPSPTYKPSFTFDYGTYYENKTPGSLNLVSTYEMSAISNDVFCLPIEIWM